VYIWYHNFIDGVDKTKKYTFDVDFTSGNSDTAFNYEDCFRFTPTQTGTHTLSITAIDETGSRVKTVTVKIVAVSKTAGSGTKRILMIGDSTMRGTGGSSTDIPGEVNAKFTTDGGITATFIGLRTGNTAVVQEGIPGFSLADFGTSASSRPSWKFTVSGVSVNPDMDGTKYTNNSSTFLCRHFKISGGNGYIVMERTSGSNSPGASGTLTKVGGTGAGDSTISFSAIATASANPFYDVSNTRVSASYYVTEFGFTTLDLVAIHLGINDFIGFKTPLTSFTAYINYLKTIVDNFKTDYSGIKIIINLQPYCGDTADGIGKDYGTNVSAYAYKKNMRNFWREVEKTFSASAYSSFVFIAIGGINIDRRNSYPVTATAISARDSATYSKISNGVHDNDKGKGYNADAIYPALRKGLS